MSIADTEKFLQDLKATLESAEKLLHSSVHEASEHVTQAREETREKLRAAGERLCDMEQGLLSSAREKLKDADGFVHGNPWRSILATAGLAFALGVLMGRRR